MNRFSVATIAALSMLCSLAWSAEVKTSVPTANTEERELLKADQEWAAAESRRDKSALTHILDERFVVTDPDGHLLGKSEFIDFILQEPTISLDAGDYTTRIHGDTGVVIGTATDRVAINGKEVIARYRYTAIYIKRHGRWKPVAEHLTKLGTP